MDYKTAGVDIEAGNAFVRAISPLAKATARPGVMGGLGGFGAAFDPKAAGFDNPVVVASSDGVGTKLKVAIEIGCHSTIGIDLVAMCVNDVVTQGAEPAFFLDYFATSKLDQKVAVAVVQGIAEGCKQAGCALVGGETAEMPEFYPEGYYDLAGFAVGLADRERLLPAIVGEGDVLLGLASSGVHSNGFSLIRRICADAGASWDSDFDGRTLGETFLTPTPIYVPIVLELHRRGLLHAAAHITGGGLIGNLPRVLPAGLTAQIDRPWCVRPEFGWLQRTGGVPPEDMLRTFNCGIGMVLVVAERDLALAIECAGEPILLGQVIAGSTPQIALPDETWWL